MKTVGIIGAGFTGLAAGFYLQQKGFKVTIIEKDEHPGGLAVGFNVPAWDWTLEKHYHHWFTNDASVLELAKELNYPVVIKRPKTSVYVKGSIDQLDSPIKVLTYPHLTLIEKLRMAAVLAALRYNPFWKPLEKIHASTFLEKTIGKNAYKTIWEPQLTKKFGVHSKEISLAWFWARIKKRTPSLAYPTGGYLRFAQTLVKKIEKMGGRVLFNTEITKLEENENVTVEVKREKDKTKNFTFDTVIVTTPSFLFLKIAPQLTDAYKKSLASLKGLGAINLVLRLKDRFLTDATYWLSICDTTAPIMAIVEHTNFMDKKNYNNEHIVYLGNYLPATHEYFSYTNTELLATFEPFLRKINPDYKKNLIDSHIFKAPFAQPIIPVNYSKLLPPFKTPLPHVFLFNIEQVYPWDRGTNYAVELGKKAADFVEE